MTINFKLFDTKTKQDFPTTYSVKNCLAEYLFPDVEFNIGIAYPEATIPEDLKDHDSKTLQFASKHRMIYASDPTVRKQLYPNASDGVAYPLPFTPCLSFHKLPNVRILVVDDVTGENGGVIPDAEAKKLVGDCKGLIDKSLAEVNGIKNVFQFRLGIKPQEQNPVMRIAKGTLAPAVLDFGGLKYQTSQKNLRAKTGYDLVLATSSFKGRKGESAITPGEYLLGEIGLGVKYEAVYRPHSLGTQFLVNYPVAVQQEILPILKEQAIELADAQKDVRKLAALYVEDYERRKELNPELSNEEPEFDIFDNLSNDDEAQEQEKDLLVYEIIKADLNGYCQLLEHPRIIAELQDFTRKKWRDIATGNSIKFTGGMAQPSLDLNENEVCIPIIPDGEKVIVSRSPLINSNGVIILINKKLPNTSQGCVYLNPKAAMDHLQCDFDGDYPFFARYKDFPVLGAEIEKKLSPEHRYPPIIKKDKIPYQGTFQEIACSAIESKIGIIANAINKNIALQSEIDNLPETEKISYIEKFSKNLKQVLKKHDKNQLEIPGNFIYKINDILLPYSNSQEIEKKLQIFKELLKESTGVLGNELQIAVDGPKSALRPNPLILKACSSLTNYKKLKWQSQKKDTQVYLNNGISSDGYSCIDLMIQQTNKIFEQSRLNLRSRPIHQFRQLYSQIKTDDWHISQAKKIQTTCNLLLKKIVQLNQAKKTDTGPYIVATSPVDGRKIKITNLIKYDNAKNYDFWNQKVISLKILQVDPDEGIPHQLQAYSRKIVNSQEYRTLIGTVEVESMKDSNIQVGMLIEDANIEFFNGYNDGFIESLRQERKLYIDDVRTKMGNDLQIAAGLHFVTHSKGKYNTKAFAAFDVFPELLIDQLKKLQFTSIKINTSFDEFSGEEFNSSKIIVRFEDRPNPRLPDKINRFLMIGDKRLGFIDIDSPQLISGISATASISSIPISSLILTSADEPQVQLHVNNIDKYDFSSKSWSQEVHNVVLQEELISKSKRKVVTAKINNQILGTVTKSSLDASLPEDIDVNTGFKFDCFIERIPNNYANVIIDPETIQFDDLHSQIHASQTKQSDLPKKLVESLPLSQASQNNLLKEDIVPTPKIDLQSQKTATVLLLQSLDFPDKFQQEAQKVLSLMLKNSIDRAVKKGYSNVRLIDASPYKSDSVPVEKIKSQFPQIKIDFLVANNISTATNQLNSQDDIVIGINNFDTQTILQYLSDQGKSVIAYVPEKRSFDRFEGSNSPQSTQKNELIKPPVYISKEKTATILVLNSIDFPRSTQEEAQKVLSMMLRSSINRATEAGYSDIHVMDASSEQSDISTLLKQIENNNSKQDIKIRLSSLNYSENAIQQLNSPYDMVVAINHPNTHQYIKSAAEQGKVVISYLPEQRKFDSFNKKSTIPKSIDTSLVNSPQQVNNILLIQSEKFSSDVKSEANKVVNLMLKKTINRAIEKGYSKINIIDTSSNHDISSINDIKKSFINKNIEINLSTINYGNAIKEINSQDDIIVGIFQPDTQKKLESASSQNISVIAYDPDRKALHNFNRTNQKNIPKTSGNDLEFC